MAIVVVPPSFSLAHKREGQGEGALTQFLTQSACAAANSHYNQSVTAGMWDLKLGPDATFPEKLFSDFNGRSLQSDFVCKCCVDAVFDGEYTNEINASVAKLVDATDLD
jgi:hypothetical protein